MGGRDQRVEKREQERFCVSEVLFLPALWPLAGICTGLKRVCLCANACVCGANEKSYVGTEPEATGQRVIMHKHAYSYGTKKHTNTPNHSLYLHPISLSCNPPPIFSTPLNTSAITYRAHTRMHQWSAYCRSSPPGSLSSSCSSLPPFTAVPLSVSP